MEVETSEVSHTKRKRVIVKRRLFRLTGQPSSRPWKCKFCPADFTRYKLWSLHQQSHQSKNNHHDGGNNFKENSTVTKDEEMSDDDDSALSINEKSPQSISDNEEEDDDDFEPNNNSNSDFESSSDEETKEEEEEVEEEYDDDDDTGDRSSKLVTKSEFNGRIVTVCNFCFKVFSSFTRAMDHVGKHTGEKRYSCSSCPSTFRFRSSLTRHIRLSCVQKDKKKMKRLQNGNHHASPRSSSSSSSHKKFQSPKNEKMHPPKTSLQCSICLDRFPNLTLLKTHILRRHRRKPDNSLAQSNKVEPSLSKIKKNEDPKESSGMKMKQARMIVVPHEKSESEYVTRKCDGRHGTYRCNLCNRKFPTAVQAVSHVRTHTGEQPFQCSQCKRKFSMRANCIRHIRVHTGETPYSCSICSKKFTSWDNLDHHVKSHHLNQKRKRIQVKKKTSRLSKPAGGSKSQTNHHESKWGQKIGLVGGHPRRGQSLKKKKKINRSTTFIPTQVYKSSPYICCTVVNEKVMYVCNFCNKMFDRPSLAVIHSRIHTGETEFQCDSCDRGFNRRYRLKVHQEKCHS